MELREHVARGAEAYEWPYGDRVWAIEQEIFGRIAANQFPANATSAAYENARIVKAAPGTLIGFSGYSSRATSQFVQVHDAAKVPTTGDVPAFVMPVNATAGFNQEWGTVRVGPVLVFGRTFQHGIVIVNSTTGPTYTAGAADTFFDVQYW